MGFRDGALRRRWRIHRDGTLPFSVAGLMRRGFELAVDANSPFDTAASQAGGDDHGRGDWAAQSECADEQLASR